MSHVTSIDGVSESFVDWLLRPNIIPLRSFLAYSTYDMMYFDLTREPGSGIGGNAHDRRVRRRRNERRAKTAMRQLSNALDCSSEAVQVPFACEPKTPAHWSDV